MNQLGQKDINILAVHKFDAPRGMGFKATVQKASKADFLNEALEIIDCSTLAQFPFQYKGTRFMVWFDGELADKPELPLPSLLVGELGVDETCILVYGDYIITRTDEEHDVIGIEPSDKEKLRDYTINRSQTAVLGVKLGLFRRKKSA